MRSCYRSLPGLFDRGGLTDQQIITNLLNAAKLIVDS
jgi:hypothetical protein